MPTRQHKPGPTEYASYYEPYLSLVDEEDMLAAIENQVSEITQTLEISEDDASVVHAPYSWTIKQAVGHMIDNERVFGYRGMRIAAGDPLELPGYDQEEYVRQASYNQVPLEQLTHEFLAVRQANLAMIRRWPEAAWSQIGICDGRSITARSIACLLVGHARHHLRIINQRLGK